MLKRVAETAHTVLDAVAGVVGIRALTPEPRFEKIETLGEIEIRRYPARRAAETLVEGGESEARNEGFSRLADYIFGQNARSERIAMTAPVAQDPEAEGFRVRFFLPADLTDPPSPFDPRVAVVDVPPETVAVLRFAGSTGPDAVAEARAKLLGALDGTSWRATGEPVAWFFDPPWTLPPLRRTEVAVPVEPAGVTPAA